MRTIQLLLIATLVSASPLTACGSGNAEATPGAPSPEQQALTFAKEADVLLLDVRTPGEFAAGHVEGAVNVPLGETARMAEVIGRKDRPVILYCRSGNRSGQALRALQADGHTRLVNTGSFGATASLLGKAVVRSPGP